MEAVEFRRQGKRVRLTRQQVIDAVRNQIPEPVNAWAVQVEGRRFPVVQVWACATGEPRGRGDKAVGVLERLGFRPFHTRKPGAARPIAPADVAGDATESSDRHAVEQRLAALEAAVRFASGRPDSRVADVLEVAEAFENWLAR